MLELSEMERLRNTPCVPRYCQTIWPTCLRRGGGDAVARRGDADALPEREEEWMKGNGRQGAVPTGRAGSG